MVGRALTLEDIVDLEDEALAETGNIILNSWVATLANLLKRGLEVTRRLCKAQMANIECPTF